jgi:hypothetical protein
MKREIAIQIFMKHIVLDVYHGTYKGMEQLLLDGPAGRSPSERYKLIHKWYQSLDSHDKQELLYFSKFLIEFTVFNFLTFLDGALGGYPVKGKHSEFAIYLQTYSDLKAMENNTFEDQVKINLPFGPDDLHDLFKEAIDEKN